MIIEPKILPEENDLVITVFPRLSEPTGTRKFFGEVFPEDLEFIIVRHKNDYNAKLFSAATFAGNQRKKKYLETVAALVYDFDKPDTPVDVFISKMVNSGYNFVVYTTYSHIRNGEERYRLILPFDKPYKIYEEEEEEDFAKLKTLYKLVSNALSLPHWDSTSDQLERQFFLPIKSKMHDDNNHTYYRQITDKYIEPEKWLKDIDKSKGIYSVDKKAKSYKSTEPLYDKKSYNVTDRTGRTYDLKTLVRKHGFVRLADLYNDKLKNLIIKERSGEKSGYHIVCPFNKEHTVDKGENETGTFVDNPTSEVPFGTICCLHSHCAERRTLDFIEKLVKDGHVTIDDLEAYAGPYIVQKPNNVVALSGLGECEISVIEKERPKAEKLEEAIVSKEELLAEIQKVWSSFDLEIIKEIVKQPELVDRCYLAHDIDTVNSLAIQYGYEIGSDHYKIIALFSLVDINTVSKLLNVDKSIAKRVRAQIKSLENVIDEIIDKFRFEPDFDTYILTLSRAYDEEEENVRNIFIKKRLEFLNSHHCEFLSVQEKERALEIFEELDRYYRPFHRGIVTKQSTAGKVFIDVREIKNILVPKRYETVDTLEDKYSRFRFRLTTEDRVSNIVEYWASLPSLYPTYKEIVCLPFTPEEREYYNSYDPDAEIEPIPCTKEDIKEILDLAKEILADNNDEAWAWIITWLAYVHQFPDKKIPTTIFFYGKQGAGKSKLIDTLFVQPFGIFGTILSGKTQFIRNFNAHIAGKRVVFVDEISDPLDFKNEGPLKYMISSQLITIESKGVDARVVPSYHQFVFASNEEFIVRIDDNDRRVSMFRVNNKYIEDIEFWEKVIPKLEAPDLPGKLKYYLSTLDPKKEFGIEWKFISRPLENEYRQQVKNKPKESMDFFVLDMYTSAMKHPLEEILVFDLFFLDACFAYAKGDELYQQYKDDPLFQQAQRYVEAVGLKTSLTETPRNLVLSIEDDRYLISNKIRNSSSMIFNSSPTGFRQDNDHDMVAVGWTHSIYVPVKVFNALFKKLVSPRYQTSLSKFDTLLSNPGHSLGDFTTKVFELQTIRADEVDKIEKIVGREVIITDYVRLPSVVDIMARAIIYGYEDIRMNMGIDRRILEEINKRINELEGKI